MFETILSSRIPAKTKEYFLSVNSETQKIRLSSQDGEQEINITEALNEKVEELFRGPDDPRLPVDVQKLPVGRREDFYQEFNFWFWFYDKDSDPDYDENKREDENCIRFALGKAEKYANRERPAINTSESGSSESSSTTTIALESGDRAVRIREDVRDIFPKKKTSESFTEEDDADDRDVIIIKKGWSLNGRYYTDEALEGIAKEVSKRKPGFRNHGEFNRDPIEWAVMVHSAESLNDQVTAKMHTFDYPDGDFLRERIEKAPEVFGGSIDAFILGEEGEIDGKEGFIVKEVVQLNSWDLVMFPAAGGQILPSTEFVQGNIKPRFVKDKQEQKRMTIEELKENDPSLYQLIISQVKNEIKEETDAIKAENSELKSKNAELKAELDAIKTAEEKRQKQEQFTTELDGLLQKHFTDDEVSAEFREILEDLGPESFKKIEKLVSERRQTLDAASTKVAENGDSKKNKKENQSVDKAKEDDEELSRF